MPLPSHPSAHVSILQPVRSDKMEGAGGDVTFKSVEGASGDVTFKSLVRLVCAVCECVAGYS